MKNVILLIALFFSFNSYSQELTPKFLTKMEKYKSQYGTKLKYHERELFKKNLKKGNVDYHCTIVSLDRANDKIYFFGFGHIDDKYETLKRDYIEYDDLVKLNENLAILIEEEQRDQTKESDYTSNIYVTDDGFKIGYKKIKGKTSWFIHPRYLDYDSDLGISIEDLRKCFNEIQIEIEKVINSN